MKRQQRAIATRELILDSAEIAFFKANGFLTTLDEIAALSGLTRGAIYGHFVNKDDVLRAIFERSALPLDPFTIAESGMISSSLSTVRQDLVACMRDVLADGRKRRLYGIAHWLSARESDCFISRDAARGARDLARLRIRRSLDEAVSAGEIHFNGSSESVAEYVHACLTGYFVLSLLESPRASSDDLAPRIVAYALAPVTSLPPPAFA